MNVLISGSIPPCAGLSSSSALVCAASMATAHSYYLSSKHSTMTELSITPINKTQLADVCAKCERYIGTEGGGMDQAIVLLATKGIYYMFTLLYFLPCMLYVMY